MIVGKSARSRWFELRHGSVVDRLVRETPGVAVHVLPLEKEQQTTRARTASGAGAWGKPSGYVYTALMVAGVTAGASVAIGASANGLIGGLGRSFTLQPISLEGTTGLNVAAGVAGMNLHYVTPLRPHHRLRHRRY